MVFHIITLFPEIFTGVFESSIIERAQEQKNVRIKLVKLRDFGKGPHQTVDDKPYGGGAGMIIKVDVIIAALESIKPKPPGTQSRQGGKRTKSSVYSILLSAAGTRYNQKIANRLKAKGEIALICGHYEGVDARVEKYVDDVISIGDFILTGGEIAAAAIVDSVTRLIPGVINPKSLIAESFSQNSQPSTLNSQFLEYPQYTRPEQFREFKIPQVLKSGNHAQITLWRQKQAQAITKKRHPDLISKSKL